MTQFCALFLLVYALLATQRGGVMASCPPLKYVPDCQEGGGRSFGNLSAAGTETHTRKQAKSLVLDSSNVSRKKI